MVVLSCNRTSQLKTTSIIDEVQQLKEFYDIKCNDVSNLNDMIIERSIKGYSVTIKNKTGEPFGKDEIESITNSLRLLPGNRATNLLSLMSNCDKELLSELSRTETYLVTIAIGNPLNKRSLNVRNDTIRLMSTLIRG